MVSGVHLDEVVGERQRRSAVDVVADEVHARLARLACRRIAGKEPHSSRLGRRHVIVVDLEVRGPGSCSRASADAVVEIGGSVPLMVLLLTSTTIVPAPSSTMFIADAGIVGHAGGQAVVGDRAAQRSRRVGCRQRDIDPGAGPNGGRDILHVESALPGARGRDIDRGLTGVAVGEVVAGGDDRQSKAALLPASTWMLSETQAPMNNGAPHVTVEAKVDPVTTTWVFPVPELNTLTLSLMSALLPFRVNVEFVISIRSFSPGRSLVPSLFWIQMLNWPLSLVRLRLLKTLVRPAEATPLMSHRYRVRFPDLVTGVLNRRVRNVEIGHVIRVDAVLDRSVDVETDEVHLCDVLEVDGGVFVGVAADDSVRVAAIGRIGVGEVHVRQRDVDRADEARTPIRDVLNRPACSRTPLPVTVRPAVAPVVLRTMPLAAPVAEIVRNVSPLAPMVVLATFSAVPWAPSSRRSCWCRSR